MIRTGYSIRHKWVLEGGKGSADNFAEVSYLIENYVFAVLVNLVHCIVITLNHNPIFQLSLILLNT